MKRIKFQKVEFRNFLSYGNNWQTLDFVEGLNIIQGRIVESDKSNGSGKSSLTELIPFALFGKTFKKIKKADILNWYNDKLCEVRISLDIDGVPYEIRRGMKPNKLEVYVNGTELPKLASAVDFQNQIEDEILGMDFQTFQNLSYFSPNNTISIINAKKPEKRKFLESLFDLSIYSEMLKKTNEKISANEKNTVRITDEQSMLGEELIRICDEIDNTAAPNMRKYRDKVNGLTMQVEELQKIEHDIFQDEVDRESQFLERCNDTLQEWEDMNRCSVERFSLHQKLIKEIGDISEIEKKRADIQGEIDDIESTDWCKLTEDDIADDLQKKELMKDELKQIIGEIQKLDIKLTISDNDLIRENERLQKLNTSEKLQVGDCDACGQSISPAVSKRYYKNQLKDIEKASAKIYEIQEGIQAEIKTLTKEKETLYEAVKKESDRIKEVLEDITLSQKAKETVKRLKERLDDLPDIEDIKKKLDEYEAVLAEESKACGEQAGKIHLAEIDIELSQSRLDALNERMKKKEDHEKAIDTVKFQLKTAMESYDEMKKIDDNIEKELKVKKERKEEVEKTIDENTKTITKMSTVADYLGYVKVSLKDENVKRFAISSLIPFLNKQTNHYLAESGFPYVVDVDSWLDVSIRGLGVSEVSYGSLSGGETKCIDMAVQLACNDIASMMAKASMNIMILDEVLDSSVDSLGVQSLIDIVRVRQMKNNDAVYIITHRNEIDEFTFDSVVRIIQEDKFSKIEVE